MQTQHDVEELFALAYKDDLTGLYNRRYFNRVITRNLQDFPPAAPYCFFMMDIDFFKEINDAHGHKNGDRALVRLAQLLQERFQGEETPIRFAGDEFIVFLPDTDLAQGIEKARDLVRLGRELSLPMEGRGPDIRFTLSVGVADFPEHGSHWDEVVEKADQALYTAKQGGRNRAASPLEGGAKIQRGDDLSRIFPCPEFIGGQETLGAVLDDLASWHRNGRNEPHLILCTGGRGSGKTRLLEEVGKAASGRAVPVLRLTGLEQLKPVCFGSLVRGLLQHAGSLEALLGLVQPGLESEDAPLWQAFFSREITGQETTPSGSPQRFFEHILRAVAGPERVLVLLVDDADSLDLETLELVRGFQQAADPGIRCFSVLTLTPETETTSPPETGPSVAGSGSAHPGPLAQEATRWFEIPPLDPEGIGKMVQLIFPTLRLPPSFSADLAAHSQGNPLYVEEALKLLIQRKILIYRRSAWNWQVDMFGDLPDSLDSLLKARLDSLDPEVRGLLEKASIMGPDIDPVLLREFGGDNEGYVLDLLEQARKSGILRSDDRWKDGAFHFCTREAGQLAYERIPEEDRIAWHLEMARLQRSVSESTEHLDLGSLQHHYRMAGQEEKVREVRDRLARLGSTPWITDVQPPVTRRKKEPLDEPVSLSVQSVSRVLSIFHLLRAAVQTWRLYPETSQAVSQACQRLQEGFQEAFDDTPSVHLSEAEGTLLVNGEALSWKGEEKRVADQFCRSLSAAGLKDIAFLRGLGLEETQAFLKTWLTIQQEASDAPARWEAFETSPGIEHIQVNAKVYVAVSETSLFSGTVAPDLQKPAAESSRQASDLLESIRSGIARLDRPDAPERMGTDEACRTRKLLEEIHAFLQAGTGNGRAVERGGEPPIAVPTPEPSETRTPLEKSQTALEPIEETDVRCALADILSGEPVREARGYRTISKAGHLAVEPLYHTLTQTDDAHAGRVCARFLASLCPDLDGRIFADLSRPTDPSLKKRLIQYAVPVLEKPEQKRRVLSAALEGEEKTVVLESLHQVETGVPEEAVSVLLDALPRCPGRTRMEIYACLARLGDTRCVPDLLRSLDAWQTKQDEKTLRDLESVCDALGHFSDPSVLEKLAGLIASRSRLPWRKSVPDHLRKAAFKALLRIGGEPVAAILPGYESDRDPWIRLRAKQFLQNQGRA